MRPLVVLVVLAMSAGCFQEDAPPTATTPLVTTTPEPTPTPTASPTPGPPTPTPSPTPPAPLPPLVLLEESFDFSRDGDATGRTPKTFRSRDAGAAYATVIVNASLERLNPAPATLPVSGTLNQPTIRVFAPDGTEVALVDAEGETASVTLPAQSGEWIAQFEGAGTMRGIVLITAFA